MSGTKEKATGKQNAKGNAGAVSSTEVASTDAAHLPGDELPGSVPGNHAALDTSSAGVTTEQSLMPGTDDVEVLEVRAVATQGFWRCGRWWPHEPVHVFASDDPDADNAANALEGDVVVECFISKSVAARLKAEPNLRVSVLQKEREE